MAFLERLKSIIKITDFFYSTEMLRYDDDLEYKTLTGGIASLGIIITIIVGFASLILNTLDRNTFTISTETIKNAVPTSSVLQINDQSPFRFAIQIWRQNITDNKRYFDITFQIYQQNYGVLNYSAYFPLEPCTKEYFKNYPEITNNFQELQTSTWLCPQLNTTLYLGGKYSSASYNQYIIQVSACKNATDPSRPCASPAQIQEYFQSNQNFFYFDFFFTNTQINPDKKEYKQYYIEDKSYALFGSNVGTETFLYLTDYTVQTDYSIWPFSEIQKDTGCYASELGINHPFETNINGTYITWNIAKAANSIVYTREVQKLSMVFSFMGGMVGAVSAVLFIIKVYTNVAFQFSIAFQIFKQKEQKSQNIDQKSQQEGRNKQQLQTKQSKKVAEISMNFFGFIKFYFYELLDVIGYKFNSPEIIYAKKCKDEILKQLDVKKLLKRIIFIEHCLTNILDDHQIYALQLRKPETPEEIRIIRLKCQSVVDHQTKVEDSSGSEKLEQEFYNNHQDTPSNLVHREKELNSPDIKHRFMRDIGLPEAKLTFEHQNDIILEDIQDNNEKKQPFQGSSHAISKSNNRIFDENSRIRKRQKYLAKLLNTAQEGDEISNRIWRKLDKQIRKQTMCFSKRDLEK